MNLSYRIIDMSRHHSEREVTLINACFGTWSEVFSQDLESRGAKLNKDDFHRARVLAVLESEDQLVGFHLYSVFDIREHSTLQNGYFHSLPEITKTAIRERGSRSLMTMEYLTVVESCRSKEFSGAKAAEILVRLGLRVVEYLGLDAAIGIARVDRKVNSLADSIGCEELSLMEKYNNKCSLMYFDHRQHQVVGNPFVLKLVNDLWNQRTESQPKTNKNAA